MYTQRGIRFQTDPGNHISLIDIFKTLQLEEFYWHYDNAQVFGIRNPDLLFETQGFMQGSQLKDILTTNEFMAIFAEFIGYRRVEDITEIYVWEEFIDSNAEVAVLIADCYFIDVYLKNPEQIQEYYKYIEELGYKPEFIDENDERYNKYGKLLKKFFNSILIIIGSSVIIHSIRMIIIDFEKLKFAELMDDFALPLILSLLFLLYIYLFTVITSYEILFIRLKFVKTIEESLRKRLKWRVILFCNINIERIVHFVQLSRVMQSYVKDSDDITKLFTNYKSYKASKVSQEGSNFS